MKENIDFKLTIGLFGTCGTSKWRNPFIKLYKNANIPYFNPQVDDWKPELAEIEAHHLAKDGVILFPVTSETYGTGSLSEVGFSIINAIKYTEERTVILLIDQELDESLSDEIARKESLRARKLLQAHLNNTILPNVIQVLTFEEMYFESIKWYCAQVVKRKMNIEQLVEKFNIYDWK